VFASEEGRRQSLGGRDLLRELVRLSQRRPSAKPREDLVSRSERRCRLLHSTQRHQAAPLAEQRLAFLVRHAEVVPAASCVGEAGRCRLALATRFAKQRPRRRQDVLVDGHHGLYALDQPGSCLRGTAGKGDAHALGQQHRESGVGVEAVHNHNLIARRCHSERPRVLALEHRIAATMQGRPILTLRVLRDNLCRYVRSPPRRVQLGRAYHRPVRRGMTAETSFLAPGELAALGLGSCGERVSVSRKASIYCPSHVYLGSDVRVDDFSVITAGSDAVVRIGNHVHIAAHAALFGGGGIVMEDFSTASSRVSVYSVTDDYSGEFLTNPTIPKVLTGVIAEPVVLEQHVVVGAGTVILPGVRIGIGSAVGALSLVNKDLPPWGLYVGIPARLLRPRSQRLLDLARRLLDGEQT
jgi:acetyltransferase-like isoleucine patch superfamily enzyme